MKWLIVAEIEGDKPSPKVISKLKEEIENTIIESVAENVKYINIRAVNGDKIRK